ncbi:unnamed protein product [Lampetra planeri]
MMPSKTWFLRQLRVLEPQSPISTMRSILPKSAWRAQPSRLLRKAGLDIASHLRRLLSAAAHFFKRMTAATSTGRQDAIPAAVVAEVTGSLDLPAIPVVAAALCSSEVCPGLPCTGSGHPLGDGKGRPDLSEASKHTSTSRTVASCTTEPVTDEQAYASFTRGPEARSAGLRPPSLEWCSKLGQPSGRSPRTCYRCGHPGHITINCHYGSQFLVVSIIF